MSCLVIDCQSVVCRGYFKEQADVRRSTVDKTAEPTIARTTARFVAMIDRLLSEHRPTHAAAVLEGHGLTFRHRESFEYKARRSPKPDALVALLEAVPELLKSMGVPTLRVDGYEADDVIASLVTRHAGLVLVSPDKDFHAHWGRNGMRQFDPLKHRPEWPVDQYPGDWVTARDVFEKWGVDPGCDDAAKIVEVQALMGDVVDGVTGCPGVGDKTAIALIQAFGTVEAVYAALHAGGKLALPKECQKYAAKLEVGYDAVRLSRRLVTLVADLDVRAERLGPGDPALREELARRFGWGTATETQPQTPEPAAAPAW